MSSIPQRIPLMLSLHQLVLIEVCDELHLNNLVSNSLTLVGFLVGTLYGQPDNVSIHARSTYSFQMK